MEPWQKATRNAHSLIFCKIPHFYFRYGLKISTVLKNQYLLNNDIDTSGHFVPLSL